MCTGKGRRPGESHLLFDQKKNKIVCCYQGEIDKKRLSAELRQFLPDYMIPNVFRKTETMPITKTEKLIKRHCRHYTMRKSFQMPENKR